jgi:hypothetical protein
MQLGLTTDQLAERRKRLHAGDAANVMAGNYRAVFRRIKGLDPDDDLRGEFRVQLGSYTEPFNLAWTMRQTGRTIDYYSGNALMRHVWNNLTCNEMPRLGSAAIADELVICKRHPFMAANLDGMTTTPEGHPSVIDAKHVARATEQEVLRYTPAGVWQATCAGTDWWGLSWIVGNKWEPPTFQEVDPLYQAEMIQRATDCWSWIENGEEPPEAEAEAVLPPKPTPKLRSIAAPVEEDEVWAAMVRKDNWLSEARDHIRAIIGTDAAAKVNAIHRASMKELVPPEVGEITLGRYRFNRSKAGAVTQVVAKLETDNER